MGSLLDHSTRYFKILGMFDLLFFSRVFSFSDVLHIIIDGVGGVILDLILFYAFRI